MKPSRFPSLRSILPELVVFATMLAIYLGTIAPGLTWANDGSDGADLITAAATGGVPHPTGYPLYLLLARLFQLLPVGSLAFRTNLMSAVCMSLAAALVTGLVNRSVPPPLTGLRFLAGMAAGFAYGLAPLAWSQAVITEVYALQALLTAWIVYLYTVPKSTSWRLDVGRGLLLGLAMANHITALLIVPAALLVGSFQNRLHGDGIPPSSRPRFGNLEYRPVSLRGQLTGLGLGLALYLTLLLRALAHPPVDWGGVVSLERLWWLVSGQLYQSYYLQLSLSGILQRVEAFAAVLVRQLGLPGVLLGLVGLIVFGSWTRLTLLTVWIAAANTAFVLFYRSADSYVYLLPVILCFAIWLGLGLAGLVDALAARSPALGAGLAVVFMLFVAARSVSIRSEVDASQDRRAESFGREVFATAPENAILFAKGDQAVFTLWYFHFALGERPDLAIVAEELLHYDWYEENLRSVYPSLVVPGPFPWPETIAGANPWRVVCDVESASPVELSCIQPPVSP